MREQIKIALWNKVKSTYPIGTSKHTNALLEEDFDSFIEDVVKICTIHEVVGRSEQLLAFLEWYDSNVCQNDCRSRDELVNDFINQ